MGFKLDNIQNTKTEKTNTSEGLSAFLQKEITIFGNGFSDKKKQQFYLELAILLQAGVTLKDGLALFIESLKKEADKVLFQTIVEQVVNGEAFSTAIVNSGKFTEYEYHSLKIGEETGTIDKVCHQLGVYYERKNEQKRIVIGALTYPCIVLFTALGVVFFMLSYVVPMFQGIFEQNNMELPWITKGIITASDLVSKYGWLFFLGLVVIFILSRLFKDNRQYQSVMHWSLLKTPIVGTFVSKVYLAQFTQAISLLTSSKIPILTSIQMVNKMIRFVPLQQSLNIVEASVLQGNSLSQSLKGTPMFDNRIVSLVKVAEETNKTEYIFQQLNEQYNNEVIQQSKLIATVLEPFIIVVVGGIVAVLMIAMYLPMFQLSSVIG